MTRVPRKTFHFGPQCEVDLVVMFEAYMALSALLYASTSILEADGFDTAAVRATVLVGDKAWVRFIRRCWP